MDFFLQFSGQINRIHMRKVRQTHIDMIRERLADTEIWQKHLEYTMRDALHFQQRMLSALSGNPDVEDKPVNPKVEGLAIALVAQEQSGKFDREAGARFMGTVSWRSTAVDTASLSAAVFLRIKERFTQRVLCDDKFGLFTNLDTCIQRQSLIPKIDAGSGPSSAQSSPQCPSSPVASATSVAPLFRPTRLFQSLRKMVAPR
jgi:hypothetical protein